MQTDSELAQVPERNCCLFKTSFHQIERAEKDWVRVTKHFFFSWEPLHLTSCWHHGPYYCQCAYFPKGPELCDALLCQDFLVKILICLPSRLQSGFCLARTTQLLGKGFLDIISFPGYSHPFLVIQYQNNTLYSCTPPCSSNKHCWCDHFCTSQISILTSCCNTLASAFLHYVFYSTTVSYG